MSQKDVSNTRQTRFADNYVQNSAGVIVDNVEPQEKMPKLDADCSSETFDRKIELNQQTSNNDSQMQNVNQNQNQVVAIDAVEPNGYPKPAIFKLDADCWDEIFDCLEEEDLESFGQTCTVFEGVVGKYFQWQYTRSVPVLEDDDFEERPCYIKYTKKVIIVKETTYSTLCHIASKCKAVNDITLECIELNRLLIETIDKLLNKVEHLFINSCTYDEDMFRTLIESCGNLKEITLIGEFPSSWPDRHYPKYQTLSMDDSMDMNILIPHIQQNSSVRNLSIEPNHLLNHRNDILNSNIELDIFAVYWSDNNIDDLIDLLNELYKKGFYKKLLVYLNERQSIAQLIGLPGMIYLVIDMNTSLKMIEYPILSNVMGLEIRIGCDMDMNIFAKSFVNLKDLNISSKHIDDFLPFVRHSVNLKNITFRETYDSDPETLHCKISVLNGERKKLKGACKVTIHVSEDIYLTSKWGKMGTTLDLVEIKRNEWRNENFQFYTHYDNEK